MGTDAPLPRMNADFLVRPRLLGVLDEWSPVSLVLAPSGAGKAVLAVQWAVHAREEGHEVMWFDGEVDDPTTVVTALARRAGVAFAGEGDAEIPDVLRRLRRDLQGLPRRLALVVNNAEPIVEAIGAELVEIVRDCREVHLVACLRRRLDPVAKALLEAETRIIGMGDLPFTVDEVRALAHQHHLELTVEEAEAIRLSVGGWSALVRTGFETLPDADGRPVTAWSPRHVAWFLAANVEPVLPPSGLAALCRTALVEQPTYGAVLAATGPLDEAARASVEALGILDPLVSDGEPIVRLPPLMRDFFGGRYDEAELGPRAEVHHRVVEFWRAQGEREQALRQAVRGRCWTVAVEIVEAGWWDLLPDLRDVPAAEVRGHPRAELSRQVLVPDDPAPSSPVTRAWEAELRSASLDDLSGRVGEPEVLAVLTLLLVRDRGRGDHAAALDLAQRVEAVVGPSVAEDGVASPAVRRAALEAGRAWLASGDFISATRVLRIVGDATGELALAAAASGERLATDQRPPGSGERTPAGRVAAAFDALQSLDRQRTADLLAELRSEADVGEELRPWVARIEAEHALLWGGRSRVRARLATVRGSAARRRETPWLRGLLDAAEANLCTSLGRTPVAARLLDDADPRSSPVLLARARLERVVGHPDRALAVLDGLAAAGVVSRVLEVEALVLRAWCLDDASGAEATAALELALEAARPERLVLPFAHVPTSLLERHARRVSGLGQVMAVLRQAQVRAAYDLVDEPPAITPRESAVLAALARGLSLEEVGRELFVSRNTVKTQVASLYRKLQVGDRAEAVHKATRMGLLG